MTNLHRTNINLNRRDYEYLLARYGFGWTGIVRDLVAKEVKRLREEPKPEPKAPGLTLEDLK